MLLKFVPTSTDLQISSSTINPRMYCLIFHIRMNLKYQQKESLSRDRQIDEEKKKQERMKLREAEETESKDWDGRERWEGETHGIFSTG